MNKKLFLLLLFLTPVFASYYADLDILVSSEGVVSISGLTNHPGLYSGDYSHFTTISGPYTIVNLTFFEDFSQYTYTLTLPEGSVINYLYTPSVMSLTNENNHLILTAVGSDEPFKAVVQYSISKNGTKYYYLLLLLPLLLIPVYYYFKKKPKNKIDYSVLTERQVLIMKEVVKRGRVTQKYLEDSLKLPKSSLSRNIESLIRKGLIVKERKGMTNLLLLKK